MGASSIQTRNFSPRWGRCCSSIGLGEGGLGGVSQEVGGSAEIMVSI